MEDRNHRSSGQSRRAEEEHHTNPWTFSLKIGFFAGAIWGLLRWLLYGMNFTKELPGFFLEPFFKHDFLASIQGSVMGLAAYMVFSMAAAALYYRILGKLRGPWPGIFYGLGWWAVLFIAGGPFMGMTVKLTNAGWNSIFTELCIFTLWGLFIGYSIAFEFTEEASREPFPAK
ncbi:YqhR family membrane protein [Paenibacillus sp. HB172176]|uniref:YqhR family membrane protein n=1 Tax=Paenibacillus sp. HB172176 TaxID=2493690 RepID=UPI001439FD00|nr:YqhR family membrane protein [Paenibacillus sp. HB172176]